MTLMEVLVLCETEARTPRTDWPDSVTRGDIVSSFHFSSLVVALSSPFQWLRCASESFYGLLLC